MIALLNRRKTFRETHEVPEPTPPDVLMQNMRKIRDHRLRKAEVALAQSRLQCVTSRRDMRAHRDAAVVAKQRATTHWADALADFQNLSIDAKHFVACKCKNQQLKQRAKYERSCAQAAVAEARDDRERLKEAQKGLRLNLLKAEKLRLLTELRQAQADMSAI